MDVELTQDEIDRILGELASLPQVGQDAPDWDSVLYGAKVQLKKFVDYLDGFKCDECETPDFISLVLPKKVWRELNRLGGGYDDKCKV